MWIWLAIACTPSEVPGGQPSALAPPPPSTTVPPTPQPGGTSPSVQIVINEFQAANESTWQFNGDWSFPDWVELYNAGTEEVYLRDLALIDGGGDTWRGPDDGKLSPGERVFLSSTNADGRWELPFSLDADGGDTLYLAYQGAPMDIVPVGVMADDVVLARYPDGGAWHPSTRATPNEINGSAASDSLDPTDDLFRAFVLHEISVTVDRALYDDIDARIPTPGELTIDGIYFRKVDIKSKGQASYDTMAGKPRLTFDLDNYDTTREFRGVDNLELHNGKVADASRVRDWATYRYAREAGLPAGRIGFTHLAINNDDYGLYVLVENPDDKWIEARFPASAETGMLFEGGDFGGSLASMEYETGPDPANAESVAAMEAADAIVSGPETDLAVANLWTFVEHENTLNYIAFEGISNHWDGYDSPHNYRWYVDGVTHRSQLVVAGAEITWTGDPELWTSNGNLAEFCLDNPACKRSYAEHVLAMADLADAIDVAGDMQAVYDWVRPHIVADPRKFTDMATADGVFDSSLVNAGNNAQEARIEVYQEFPDLMP